jgi:MFS family permease
MLAKLWYVGTQLISFDWFLIQKVSFLLPALEQDWHISAFWKASVAAVAFIGKVFCDFVIIELFLQGMLIGAPLWGMLCDRYGRRYFIDIENR